MPFCGHVSQTMPHQITLFSVWACTSSAVTSSSGQIVIRSHHHDSSSRVSRGIVMFHISLVSDCGVSSRSMMSHVTGRLLRKCCLRHVVRLVNWSEVWCEIYGVPWKLLSCSVVHGGKIYPREIVNFIAAAIPAGTKISFLWPLCRRLLTLSH